MRADDFIRFLHEDEDKAEHSHRCRIQGSRHLGLNVLAYNHARAMMHFTTEGERTSKPEALSVCQKAKVLFVDVNIPRPTGRRSSSDLAVDGQTLTINGSDGITLGVIFGLFQISGCRASQQD